MFDLISFEPLIHDLFKGYEIALLVENHGSKIPSVEGMIASSGFICAFWSGYPAMHIIKVPPEKET